MLFRSAVEDGLYKARRAVKTARCDLQDARDQAEYRIKQRPFRAVGVAFGAGLGVAAAAGLVAWVIARVARRPAA